MAERDVILDRLQELVALLGPLKDRVVLVGGAAPATWDLGPVDVRQTEDIDLVVEGGYPAFHGFQQALRDLGFRAPPRAHLSRLARDRLLVDVVPVDGGAVAENPWYQEAWDTARPNAEVGLRVITPGLFVATKLQAFSDPGRMDGGDLYVSHDIEDVVRVLRGLPSALHELGQLHSRAHRYARFELRRIAHRPDALDILQAHMEADAASKRTALPLLEALLALPR